jgi:hypothetical protein
VCVSIYIYTHTQHGGEAKRTPAGAFNQSQHISQIQQQHSAAMLQSNRGFSR